MYKVTYTHDFIKQLTKLTKKNKILQKKVNEVVSTLEIEPFYPGLMTHLIGQRNDYGHIWSSRVTGDIRILWFFHPYQENTIVLTRIGGHDFVY